MKLVEIVVISLLCLFIFSCSTGGSYQAPVAEIGEAHKLNSNIYVVHPGDTLYSIAWTYGYDYRDLARWNNLKEPYVLHKNQKIELTSRKVHVYGQSAHTDVVVRSKAKQHTNVKKSKSKYSDNEIGRVLLKKGHWFMPARGKVFTVSNSDFYRRKGIYINGEYGSPIHAAVSGKVVYSGTGLRGYGNLIIIEHDPSLLSAYAFNKDILVKRGERVKANQLIAHMGHGPRNKPALYFEVRSNGKPVNPMKYVK